MRMSRCREKVPSNKKQQQTTENNPWNVRYHEPNMNFRHEKIRNFPMSKYIKLFPKPNKKPIALGGCRRPCPFWKRSDLRHLWGYYSHPAGAGFARAGWGAVSRLHRRKGKCSSKLFLSFRKKYENWEIINFDILLFSSSLPLLYPAASLRGSALPCLPFPPPPDPSVWTDSWFLMVEVER